MVHSFYMTFVPAGKGWRTTVVQTEGSPVLPDVPSMFRGKSLASVQKRVILYLSNLDLGDWTVSYDLGSVLQPGQSQLLNAAQAAMQEAEAAENRRIRRSYLAIEELSATGFSMRDISVLLRESKTAIQRILSDGKLMQEAQDQRAHDPTPSSAGGQGADLREGPEWYSRRHAEAGLSPGGAVALEIGYEVIPETEPFPGEVALVQRLPDRFARRYDREFIAKFASVLEDVYDAITEFDITRVSSTPAQEIALAVLMATARHSILQLADMGVRIGFRDDLESLRAFREAVTEDLDVDLLWGHENDGLEEDAERMDEVGIGKALLFEKLVRALPPELEGGRA